YDRRTLVAAQLAYFAGLRRPHRTSRKHYTDQRDLQCFTATSERRSKTPQVGSSHAERSSSTVVGYAGYRSKFRTHAFRTRVHHDQWRSYANRLYRVRQRLAG